MNGDEAGPFTYDQLLCFLGVLLYLRGGSVDISAAELDRITTLIDNTFIRAHRNIETQALRLSLEDACQPTSRAN